MRSAVLAICVAVSGCSAGSSPESGPPDDVAAQERVWREAGLDSYRFGFQQQCFCVREQVQPVTVEVRDGRVERVLSSETGRDLSNDPGLRWHTIADLFDLISEARTNATEPLVVRYHPRLGYPMHIETGSLAADAGVVYSVSDLEPLR